MKPPSSSVPRGAFSVPGFPYYCITRHGTVYSCRTRGGLFRPWTPMAPGVNRGGLLQVRFYRNLRAYHRPIAPLVASIFIGRKPRGMECCHTDGNPSNNNVTNLRWDTHKNNMADRTRHGRDPIGVRNAEAILNDAEVFEIRRRLKRGEMQKDLAPEYGVAKQTIQVIAAGETWRHLLPVNAIRLRR